MDAGDSEKLQEVFGSGTAAVISPVGKIKWADKEITIGDGQVGPLTKRLFKIESIHPLFLTYKAD